MKIAHLWPVIADYNGLSAYATHRGGRLPTEAELRLFFDKFEISYEEGRNVGFRNWHPVPWVLFGLFERMQLRPDIRPGMNSATTGGEGGGRGHNGGVWEWTSTVWDKHDRFEGSTLYPGFSSDFFDTHHNTVVRGESSSYSFPCMCSRRDSKIGGSYLTTPRLAERRTLRNWYQRNYPYAFIGARVVYDVGK
jgi:L-histidine Nalpha-methyltransferase / hercynylcysteine S-oxide synthase